MNGLWWATERALTRVFPAKVVTVLLAEPRGLVAVARWIRRKCPDGATFPRHREVVVILWVVVAMTILEGAVAELVLRVVLGSSVWVWIALALHGYAVSMIVAVYAGMVTRPHSLDGSALTLRAGLATDVVVDAAGVVEARPGRYPAFDRSGWRVDADGNATLALGEANLRLTLAEGVDVMVNGRVLKAPRSIHLTVDEPRHLAAALRDARSATGPGAPSNTTAPA